MITTKSQAKTAVAQTHSFGLGTIKFHRVPASIPYHQRAATPDEVKEALKKTSQGVKDVLTHSAGEIFIRTAGNVVLDFDGKTVSKPHAFIAFTRDF